MRDAQRPEEAIDQRKSERRQVVVSLKLIVEEQSLAGRTRDASPSGVMFTTDAVLRVEVELDEDGKLVRRTGRLSRVQRLDAREIAVAVEFDRD